MRLDKLTTTLQHALQDAHSLAVSREHPYIEPVHLLLALLAQADGPRSLLERAGANVGALKTAADAALAALPQVQGGQVQVGRDLVQL
ncbi:MAG: Clp protease N-terminal domain-containing protein, partial [Betaproteobacteria bacterium]